MKITPQTSQKLFDKNHQAAVKFGVSNKVASKALKALEFDNINFSTLGLCAVCYAGVFAPRYFKSRDNNERREILVRDLPTITTVIFGRRVLQNIVSKICTLKTGLALHVKPEKHDKPLQKIFNYLRPDKGIRVLSSDEIVEKYSNIHHNKNGISDFADFITEQGGDIKKVLTFDKDLEKHLKTAYTQFKPKGSFEKANSTEIKKMFSQLGRQNSAIKEIENILSNPQNSLVKRAKRINSTFDFLSTLVFVPIILGFLLPYINEQVTKKNCRQGNKKASKS